MVLYAPLPARTVDGADVIPAVVDVPVAVPAGSYWRELEEAIGGVEHAPIITLRVSGLAMAVATAERPPAAASP